MKKLNLKWGFVFLLAFMASGLVCYFIPDNTSPQNNLPCSSINKQIFLKSSASIALRNGSEGISKLNNGRGINLQNFVKHYKGTNESIHIPSNTYSFSQKVSQIVICNGKLLHYIRGSSSCFLRAPPILA